MDHIPAIPVRKPSFGASYIRDPGTGLETRLDESPRELVERVLRKDRAAFAELVQRYERTALAIAYAVTGDSSTAGDVSQEAFLRVWQHIGRLDDPERFGGWLGRIVRNLATDHVRRRPREIKRP